MRIKHFWRWFVWVCLFLTIALGIVALVGCGTDSAKKKGPPFFTSGSREADQRASQRMAQSQQLGGTSGEQGEKPAEGIFGAKEADKGDNAPKAPLFQRLGGEAGLTKIVQDFLPRAMADPRVNWDRKDVTYGGFWVFTKGKSVTWNPTPENVAKLQTHIIQFFALATGGPSRYDGRELKSVHAEMKISNPEFDAVVGDLKASLDKLRVPDEEQKQLLAVVESTRPLVVTVR